MCMQLLPVFFFNDSLMLVKAQGGNVYELTCIYLKVF